MDFLKHLIGYEIQTAAVCPYRFLFDKEFIDRFTEKDDFKFSNIYFFTRVKKVRFDLSKTQLTNKRTLKTELIIGDNERKEVESDFYSLSSLFRGIYKDKEDYFDLVSDDDDFWDCEFLKDESNGTTLVFTQIAKGLNQRFDFIITPENFEFDLDIEVNNPPEIVYIGQSFRMLERIQSHKTLHKAVSQLKDNEELRLYFLAFKYHYGGHKELASFDSRISQVWMSQHGKNEYFKSKIDLVERFLIHFFKPEFNEQHVNCKIDEDSIVKKLLLENKVSTVSINYGMYGKAFQFYSPNRILKEEFCSFNFEKPENGYVVGFGE